MAHQAMNASPYHPKVKTSIRLGDSLYVAGGVLTGKMQMECKADKGLGIGPIVVELFAIEELTSRDHSATSTFLHSRRVFQGPGLPPSNAVHPHPLIGEPPLPLDYYPARRGITTFLFRFSLPPSLPSAINFGNGLANVKYEIRASVGVAWKGERRLVTDKKQVDVVEQFEEDYTRGDPEGVIIGENGKMWVQGRLVGGILVAGQPACIELQVKNHSTKKNSGLSLTLTRELRLPHFPVSEKAPLRISDTLTSVSFRGQEYIIQPGTEGVANLVFDVPATARGVKGTERYGDEEDNRVTECLFEVRCIVGVKLSMGFGSRDIQLDIPVTVLHPRAMPELSELPPAEQYPPLSPSPYLQSQVPYMLPTSPDPYFSPPYHPGPPMSPMQEYVEQGHPGWLPSMQSPVLFHPAMSPPPLGPSAYYNIPPQALLPPPPLHAYPVRPSSAEPIPSHALYSMPSGLPVPPIQQPLLPLPMTNLPLSTRREEGKGERASRIAHHLRMSSRHRSVSPQAHRYPIPTALESQVTGLPGDPVPPSPREQVPLLHPAIPLPSPPMQLTIPTGLSMSSDVASPTPLHSPKQSYSVDPFSQVTLAKSERVETLERIAADAERKFTDMSNQVPGVMKVGLIDKEKTLPVPPVPSQKAGITSGLAASRPHAQSLFPPSGSLDQTPPTPMLAASLKPPRVGGGLSGLDALEARLLAEVGTRKVEQETARPDVRSVLPVSIPQPQADPANDSAISSLNLPGLGVDEMTKIGKASSAHSAGTYRGRSRERGHGVGKEPSDVTVTKENREKKRKKEKQSEVKDEEVYRLRKAAQGRISAWLDRIDLNAPASQPESRSATPEVKERHPVDETLGVSYGNSTPQPTAAEASVVHENAHTAEDVVAQPNPRSSGFMPMSTLRANRGEASPPKKPAKESPRPVKLPPNLQKHLSFYPPRPLDPEVRYDVRSARGGRGGKVTAVAAIWASATSADQAPSAVRPPAPPAKALKPAPTVVRPQSEKREARLKPAPTIERRVSPTFSNGDKATNAHTRRAKVAKATSVPAVVSSSLATPMLSSTASLARPPTLVTERTKYKAQLSSGLPGIRETATIVSPKPVVAAKGDTAFGQARLKELIRKYQGQANA
ncbi:hypothetical protein EIP91_004752 [Steccherinum ochraceum]|uniref:Arrestin-like N-terminal domain-containing protein n=1 Tax=Steccherinum ochraceum TaxID=92696 RepID=A0A4R0R8Y1_9APHY|nr:hypothetical protein EIP91_004752 [Steccherinum ochraceum]